jgi:hypothetical protein
LSRRWGVGRSSNGGTNGRLLCTARANAGALRHAREPVFSAF